MTEERRGARLAGRAVLILAAALAAGCATDRTQPAPGENQRDGAIVVPMGTCPLSGAPRALSEGGQQVAGQKDLVGVGASFLADVAVNLIDEAIQRRKLSRTGQFIAKGTLSDVSTVTLDGGAETNDEADDGDGQGTKAAGCLVVVRGRFGPPNRSPGRYAFPFPPGSLPPGTPPRYVTREEVPLVGDPAFYLEIKIERGADDIVRLRPAALHFARSSAKRPRAVQELGVLVAFSNTAIDEDEATIKAEAVLFRHDLGALPVGTVLFDEMGNGSLLGTASVGSLEAGVSNITVLVTDSSEPGVVTEAAAKAFENNKDALGAALETRIRDALGD